MANSTSNPAKTKVAATGRKTETAKAAAAKPAPAKAAAKPAKATAAPKVAVGKAVTVKKAAAKSPTKPAAAAKPKTTAKPAVAARTPLAPDQRRYYIEVAAYYIAERRGFNSGNALEDWSQAEREIDQLLATGRLNR
jgi:hypothetical protein